MSRHLNYALAASAAVAIATVVTFATGRSSPPAPIITTAKTAPVEYPFDQTWNDAAMSVALKKADVEPRMVRPIPIVPSPPAMAKAPEPVVEPEPPKAKPEKRERHAEVNLCTRHNMTKVWVNRYKWRCRK